jgi:hypothetical protein
LNQYITTMKRLFYHTLLCAAALVATSVHADDAAVEQRLNDVYSQLRRTLTSSQKEALKQEELNWLNERDRFSRGNPRRTELTEDRIRVLQTRLSGPAPQQQTTAAAASPEGQYAITPRAPSAGGQRAGFQASTYAGPATVVEDTYAVFDKTDLPALTNQDQAVVAALVKQHKCILVPKDTAGSLITDGPRVPPNFVRFQPETNSGIRVYIPASAINVAGQKL